MSLTNGKIAGITLILDSYRELHPTVSYKIKHQDHPRSKDVQMTRLRFGHVRLAKKLHSIALQPDPNCQTCNVPEDVQH